MAGNEWIPVSEPGVERGIGPGIHPDLRVALHGPGQTRFPVRIPPIGLNGSQIVAAL
jgi:hypothetical protein